MYIYIYIYIYIWQFIFCLNGSRLVRLPFWAALYMPFKILVKNPIWTFLGQVNIFGHSLSIPGKVSDGGSGGQVPLFTLGHALKKTRNVIWRRSVPVSHRNVCSGPVSCKNRCLASSGVFDKNWSSPGSEVGQGNKR